jgi:hypothetical protein
MKPHLKTSFTLKKNPELVSRLILVVLVVFLIGATIWLSGPLPQRDTEGQIITPKSVPTSSIQMVTGKDAPDILETTPTSGVILAGLGVVIIILVGTFISIKTQNKS